MESSPDITAILKRVSSGDSLALNQLLPLVYDDLRRQAAAQMSSERPDHTLQATALVHDAYVRLLGTDSPPKFESQQHFYAAAAKAMQRILVDHARRRARLKRGGDRFRVDLTDVRDPESSKAVGPEQMLELDDALEKLEVVEPEVAELVRLRLYAGLSVTEAGKMMGISRTSAYENWDYATSWFAVELCDA